MMNIQMPEQQDLAMPMNFHEAIHKLCVLKILIYFEQSGIAINSQNKTTGIEIKERLKVQPQFFKFIDYMLTVLKRDGFIKDQEGILQFWVSENVFENMLILEEVMLKEFPQYQALMGLLNHCIDHYSAAFSGKISAVSVLYPHADIHFLEPIMTLIEAFYGIECHKNTMRNLLSDWSKQNKLSIIEVGGGVGRLTWDILSDIDPQNLDYLFTDISRFFILKAREMSAHQQCQFMRFGQFDITKSIVGQGLVPHSFDVVLAFNVIHATVDLMNSVQNLKKLLRPGGRLCIVEFNEAPIWLNLIFGVTESWWYFEDIFRKDSLLIDKNTWLQVLRQSNFTNIEVFPKNSEEGQALLPCTTFVCYKTL